MNEWAFFVCRFRKKFPIIHEKKEKNAKKTLNLKKTLKTLYFSFFSVKFMCRNFLWRAKIPFEQKLEGFKPWTNGPFSCAVLEKNSLLYMKKKRKAQKKRWILKKRWKPCTFHFFPWNLCVVQKYPSNRKQWVLNPQPLAFY